MDFKRANLLDFRPARPAMGYEPTQPIRHNYLIPARSKNTNRAIPNFT